MKTNPATCNALQSGMPRRHSAATITVPFRVTQTQGWLIAWLKMGLRPAFAAATTTSLRSWSQNKLVGNEDGATQRSIATTARTLATEDTRVRLAA